MPLQERTGIAEKALVELYGNIGEVVIIYGHVQYLGLCNWVVICMCVTYLGDVVICSLLSCTVVLFLTSSMQV